MRPTPLATIGIVLAVLGAAALIWQGVRYTQRETLINIGNVKVTADTHRTFPLPPILGGVVLAGGIALIVAGVRKS